MKTRQFVNVASLCSMLAGVSAQAALINGFGPNSSSPYYSDFEANQLDVNYVYSGNSASGTGVFTVSNPYLNSSLVTEGDSYTSSSKSPGTMGAYNQTGFSGDYVLTANISYNNGVATLTGGSFDVYGSLLGGTASSLLLSGSLVAGAGGSEFGYVDHTATRSTGEYNQFQFLINLKTVSGNPAIVADFLKNLGGEGGISLNAAFDYTGHTVLQGGNPPTTVYNYNNGSTATTANLTSTTYQGFNGLWDQNFANPMAAPVADSFVPEPSFYSVAASLAVLVSLPSFRRKANRSV